MKSFVVKACCVLSTHHALIMLSIIQYLRRICQTVNPIHLFRSFFRAPLVRRMSLDPHHVHNFWGTSPGLDLKEVVSAARAIASSDHDGDGVDDGTTKDDDEGAPLTALLVGTSDPRHIFTTLARSRRHGNPNQPLHFHVHESNMVETARHILLLCILMTDDLPPTDRMVGSWDDLQVELIVVATF